MNVVFTAFILPLLANSCQSSTTPSEGVAAEATVTETAAASGTQRAVPPDDFPMKPDTIEVRGKFMQGCMLPRIIKIAEHNELSAPWREVPVVNGEFKYRFYLAEPRRIALRTENRTGYDFIATTGQPVYQLEIACVNGMEKPELKDSPENVPYRLFSSANKKFREDLDKFAKEDLGKPDVFANVKKTISDYHQTLADIAAAHPGTFTAAVLCAAEKLPEEALESPETLRKNFLLREAFANPHIYNDFLGGRILSNYLAICDRKADQYPVFDGMMNIAVKNPDAAKRLQQVAYNVFYNRHEEEMVTAYIKWADVNPAGMYNQSVKMQLAKLKKVMPGNQFTEITLNDPSGAPKKLSDAVKSGKLTLLVFYSPTCEHCQAEIPQLKPLWEQYKSKGLKIYIVGFDATAEEWSWFIKNKASPEWTHVFEYPDGFHPSDLYVVNYTPTFILIDSTGNIITHLPELEDVKADIPRILD
ncbi:MAG TPA: TlpA disulfide reductase family protein [Chitinophagales bacterium]|nr:TlpA disulfide reductase family protein [Chitinophagales bacterium]